MKKILSFIIAALLLFAAISLSGCVKPTQTIFEPKGESKGTLKLGFDAEFEPYGYLDSKTNQYAGFDIEFAKAVCEKLGYTLELIPIDWNAKDTELESGNINCIWNGFTINGREDLYEWSDAYVDSSIVVLTASDSGIASLSDLSGKVVTVQAGSSGQTALDGDDRNDLKASFSGGTYLTCADYTTAFQDLKTGAVDAIVIDIGVAKSLTEGISGYTILTETVSSEQYGVGFFKGNTELRDTINQAMKDIASSTDTVDTLAEKYGISDNVIIGK